MTVEIDWSSAEVDGGDLHVGLTGEASDEWGERLEGVVDRLQRHARWGDVEIVDDGLKVASVREGSEEELHFFLESAVLQANAGEPEAEAADSEDEDEDDDDPDESDADTRMTEVFRSFAS